MTPFVPTADEDLKKVLAKFSSVKINRTASQPIFREDQKSTGCYLLQLGRVGVRSGDEEMTVAYPGAVIGLPNAINGYRYRTACEALEQSELLYLSRRDLLRLMKTDGSAAMKLLQMLSREVRLAHVAYSKLSSDLRLGRSHEHPSAGRT